MCGKHKCDPNDWSVYSVEAEFEKLFGKANTEWRISHVNKDYSVCQTYPSKLIVPAKVDDTTIIKSSQFRAGGRFPILSYYHTPSKSFVLRSSQPLLGSSNKKCKEDETLLKNSLPIGKKGIIYDLRDANVLKSAASKGGGYETEANYPLWKRVNRHLDRYDQLQSSFGKLAEACIGEPGQYLSRLESSNWLQNTRQALYVACSIADELSNKDCCILVHGWDGWDNTLVITSLVHVLLSPEYRTIRGFQMLIEKEWLHAGHPFSRRCAKSAFGSTSSKQEGPIFFFFLDCVRQVICSQIND
jgi:myotubularin-related protein 9